MPSASTLCSTLVSATVWLALSSSDSSPIASHFEYDKHVVGTLEAFVGAAAADATVTTAAVDDGGMDAPAAFNETAGAITFGFSATALNEKDCDGAFDEFPNIAWCRSLHE